VGFFLHCGIAQILDSSLVVPEFRSGIATACAGMKWDQEASFFPIPPADASGAAIVQLSFRGDPAGNPPHPTPLRARPLNSEL
jgi:hypothetical protein